MTRERACVICEIVSNISLLVTIVLFPSLLAWIQMQ